jgi:hypothetical protein
MSGASDSRKQLKKQLLDIRAGQLQQSIDDVFRRIDVLTLEADKLTCEYNAIVKKINSIDTPSPLHMNRRSESDILPNIEDNSDIWNRIAAAQNKLS